MGVGNNIKDLYSISESQYTDNPMLAMGGASGIDGAEGFGGKEKEGDGLEKESKDKKNERKEKIKNKRASYAAEDVKLALGAIGEEEESPGAKPRGSASS